MENGRETIPCPGDENENEGQRPTKPLTTVCRIAIMNGVCRRAVRPWSSRRASQMRWLGLARGRSTLTLAYLVLEVSLVAAEARVSKVLVRAELQAAVTPC